MIKTNAKEEKKIICNFEPHIQKQIKTILIGNPHPPAPVIV